MKAASKPIQRPRDARLLVVDSGGEVRSVARERMADLFDPGDLLVANDAATLPASLTGLHRPSGRPIELRLAGRRTLKAADVRGFTGVVFGAGDHRTRTEERAAPPPLKRGDRLALGPLRATVRCTLGHPRLIELAFEGPHDAVWAGIAAHGTPIQYAHLVDPLALWDVWTAVAARPVAFEAPSAGFVLDWALLHELQRRGVGFAALTHAAGISSTGDAALDARLPFDEAYELPAATVDAIDATRARGGRIVALGTTVTRALEHAAAQVAPLRPGPGLATQRLGAATRLVLVDAIVSGAHERGTSHHELLRAFASDAVLARADAALERHGYRSHEFGDSIWLERAAQPRSNLKTATLASRLGQRRSMRPFWMPKESRMRSPSFSASTSKST
jgi:S-adenosylmethionine:tRNA ribosyltransferase-isomerase